MRNLLLFAVVLVATTFAQAQNAHQPTVPISFYDQLKAKHGNVQRQDGSRSAVWKNIATRHDKWDLTRTLNGDNWIWNDSSEYAYNSNAIVTNEAGFAYSYDNIAWSNSYKFTHTLDGNGNNTYLLGENWANNFNIWQNTWDNTFTFDGNNDKTSYISRTWNSGSSSWDNGSKTTYVYDANHHITELTDYFWSGSAWATSGHSAFTYDGNGNNTGRTNDWWVNHLGALRAHDRDVYTWDANNHQTQDLYQEWDTAGSAWVNVRVYNTGYDVNGNATSYNSSNYWNSGANSFDNDSRGTTTFDANHHALVGITEKWSSGTSTWSNSYKSVSTYDGNGDNTTFETFTYLGGTETPSYRYTYTYDGSHNQTYYLYEQYSTGNSAYENKDRYYYYYQSFNVNDIKNMKNELGASVFPNPAVGNNLQLNFAVCNATPVTINVFDAEGRILISQTQTATTGANKVNVETGHMASGNYFVQVIDNATKHTSALQFVKE